MEMQDHTQQQIDDQAWAWIARLSRDRQPSADDIQQLHRWLAQSEQHHQTFKRISQSWDDMDVLTTLAIPRQPRRSLGSLTGTALVWLFSPLLLLWLGLQRTTAYTLVSPARFAMTSIAMVGVVTLTLWLNAPQAVAVYVTAVGQQSSHVLPDGSTLKLNTSSKVSVAYQDQRRKITLHRGEAHFDVKPDKVRPFEVYAGTRMVRAVGTAFSVYLDNEQMEVTVAEGKVAVGVQSASVPSIAATSADIGKTEPAPAASEVVEVLGSLVAGQSVLIPAGPKGVMDKITDHEKESLKRRFSWLEGQLIYAGEGLGVVVEDVSRYTPVYIEITDPALEMIRIGGQFKVGEIEALFRVLEVGFGLTVTRLSEFHVQISQAE